MSQASARTGSRRRPVIAVAALAAIGAIVAVLVLGLSSSEFHTPAELALQRSQLALVSHQLVQMETPVRRETASARATWPSIATGLPKHAGKRLAQKVSAAGAAAEALPTPAFLAVRHELIGPAARIAGLFHDFELLTQHGWAHIDQAIDALRHGPAKVASFERANSGLYIDSVYDGNFAASLIGEKVLHSYERLGAAQAFGSSLTPAEVNSIVAVYSPQADRLTPHLWRELLTQS